MDSGFSACHPGVLFAYFALVLVCTMAIRHPVVLAMQLLFGLLTVRKLNVRLSLKTVIPLLLLTAVLNPLFSHEGMTILCYLPSGNPLTLESILCGFGNGAMLAASLCWFAVLQKIMTTDRWSCLLGKAAPYLGLLFSMTLHYIPELRNRFRAAADARKALGEAPKGRLARIRSAAETLIAVLQWSMESALITADSMKSRGYGLPGRSSYSLYRWRRQDSSMLVWLICCALMLLCGAVAGMFAWRWYPYSAGNPVYPITYGYWGILLALDATPWILEEKEARRWKR